MSSREGKHDLVLYFIQPKYPSLTYPAHSDTTAATLTCLFYHFAIYPEVYRKLQKEVDEFFATEVTSDDWESSSLGKLQYLQAVIDESLRLFPPVASGLQRQTPPQGVHIGDRFIPGNTIVMTPTYTLCRDPRTFPRGDEFIPERWTTQPELVKDATPNTPFSVGKLMKLVTGSLQRYILIVLQAGSPASGSSWGLMKFVE